MAILESLALLLGTPTDTAWVGLAGAGVAGEHHLVVAEVWRILIPVHVIWRGWCLLGQSWPGPLEKDWLDVDLSLLVRPTTDLVERRLSAKTLITRSPASVLLYTSLITEISRASSYLHMKSDLVAYAFKVG